MAWVAQRMEQVKSKGEEQAPWYCFWYDENGRKLKRSFGAGKAGKKKAENYARELHGREMCGIFDRNDTKRWADFRREYEDGFFPRLSASTRIEVLKVIEHFERIISPARMWAISIADIDRYISVRMKEPGQKQGSRVSVATVNKELRHLKAMLNVAHEYGYLARPIKIKRLKEPQKLIRFITEEQFATIYAACDHAYLPQALPGIATADWWRAFIVFAFFTGWRAGDLLSLTWQDVDYEHSEAITRYEHNKGKRDERCPLHPIVIDHLQRIDVPRTPQANPLVFRWQDGHGRPLSYTRLYNHFQLIQQKAGIHLPCARKHNHTLACHVFSPHDLRRSFATHQADHLAAATLQKMMRHQSFATTQKYISEARQLGDVVGKMAVPKFLQREREAK